MTNHWKMDFHHQGLRGRLDAIGWGLAFIWIGVVFLLGFKIGPALLGLGIITLFMQGIRKFNKIPVEGFWVVVGLFFLLGGFWKVFDPAISLLPLILIGAGLVFILPALFRRHG